MFLSITQMGEGATTISKWLLFGLIGLWVVLGIILKVKGGNK